MITIKIKGEDKQLRFNNTTNELFWNNVEYQIVKGVPKMVNTSIVYAIVYGALMASYFANKQEPDFNFLDVADAIDSLADTPENDELLKSIDAAFADLTAYKNTIERLNALANEPEVEEIKESIEEKKSEPESALETSTV